MMVATHIARLAHVVLCAELTTRLDFRGADRRDPRLRDFAHYILHDPTAERGRYRYAAQDAITIANAVWFDYYRPQIINMLTQRGLFGGEERATAIVDQYFLDDAPRYEWRK